MGGGGGYSVGEMVSRGSAEAKEPQLSDGAVRNCFFSTANSETPQTSVTEVKHRPLSIVLEWGT